MNKTADKCRESHHSLISVVSYIHVLPLLGAITLSSGLPAFFNSCAAHPEIIVRKTALKISPDPSEVNSMDVFVFNDDPLQKLDCYQRFDDMADWKGKIVSSSGDRIITVLANIPYDESRWLNVSSRSHLSQVSVSLEDERRDNVFMSGELRLDTGSESMSKTELSLEPMASEIVLRSLSCDFSGKPYAGEKLEDIKVYLINVNAEQSVLADSHSKWRFINVGRLEENDMDKFVSEDLVSQEIDYPVGADAVYPDIRLWCYGNDSTEESPGTPFTRLVIEGKVSGRTWYWPIDINREGGGGNGVTRNHRYIYDITINRKGSSAPDVPVHIEDIDFNLEISQWEEKESYEVLF